MFATHLRDLLSCRRLFAGALAAAFVLSSVAVAQVSQPKKDAARPHFVGFQQAVVTGGKTMIHLKLEGLREFSHCRVVYKEPNHGRSFILNLMPYNRKGSAEMTWVIPVAIQTEFGHDHLSIKMGDNVIFDRQEGRWVSSADGTRVRVPMHPKKYGRTP